MKATIISERYDNDMISTYSYKQYIIICYKLRILCPPPQKKVIINKEQVWYYADFASESSGSDHHYVYHLYFQI